MFTTWPHSISDSNTKEEVLDTNPGVNANILFVSINNTGSSACSVDLYLEIDGEDYLVVHVELEAQGSSDGPSDQRFATKIVVPEDSKVKVESTESTVDLILSGEEYPVDEAEEWPGLHFMSANEVSWAGLAPGAEIIDTVNNFFNLVINDDGEYIKVDYKPMVVLDKTLKAIAAHRSYDYKHALGVKADGSVVADGSDVDGAVSSAKDWTDIVQVLAFGGYNDAVSIGLKEDGTIKRAGNILSGVEDWTDIVDIDGGDYKGSHAVGLKSDGTVVATGSDDGGCVSDVDSWTDIKKIAADHSENNGCSIGVKSDGTIVSAGTNPSDIQTDSESWEDIVDIDLGLHYSTAHLLGLKSDGTVVAVGSDSDGCVDDVSIWSDVKAVAAFRGDSFAISLGIKEDGSVYYAGPDANGSKSAVESWTDIVDVDGDAWDNGDFLIIGLKSDGTAVATSSDSTSSLADSVEDWTDLAVSIDDME